MHEYFLTTYRQTKGNIHWKLCILQKRNLYLNQFSNKKRAIGKPERPKSTLSGPHIPIPTFPLSTPPSNANVNDSCKAC